MRRKAFLIPGLTGFLLFFVLPCGIIIYYAMIDNAANHHFVGLQQFVKVCRNKAFVLAFTNTIKFTVTAVPLAVLLSLGLAAILDSRMPFIQNVRACFLCPMMVPAASVILVWRVFFDQKGVVNQMMTFAGGEAVDWLRSDYGLGVLVFLFLWKNLGYNMIVFMAALANVPREALEVAQIEGASSFMTFWKIKRFYISPTIVFVTLLSLMNSFKIFREAYLLTGDYPYQGLYLLQHFMNNTFLAMDYQKMSAAAILIALVMIAVLSILFFVEKHMGKDLEE